MGQVVASRSWSETVLKAVRRYTAATGSPMATRAQEWEGSERDGTADEGRHAFVRAKVQRGLSRVVIGAP